MRSQFSSTFQPALGGHHQVALGQPTIGLRALRVPRPSMIPSRSFFGGSELGRALTSAEIDDLTAKISAGRQKLARINAWIESKKAVQPFGWKLFDDEALEANFWNWSKTAASEEDSVARVWAEITNPTTVDYDVNQDDLILTKDWINMVNWMADAMERYGTSVKPGAITTTPPGGRTSPGTTTQKPSTGIPTKDLITYGGIGLGAIALILLLKGA